MTRFRRGGFRRKGTREQLVWYRLQQAQANAAGAMGSVSLFSPTAVLAGAGLDQRMTVRAIRLVMQFTIIAASTAPESYIQCGVNLAGLGEPTRNPSFAAVGDQQADWLDDFVIPFRRSGANILPPDGCGIFPDRRIKAMRKVEGDQEVRFSWLVVAQSGAADAAGRVNLVLSSSVLFQRTRR